MACHFCRPCSSSPSDSARETTPNLPDEAVQGGSSRPLPGLPGSCCERLKQLCMFDVASGFRGVLGSVGSVSVTVGSVDRF
eukprot:8651447-Alexandrium_andersonii.AAC.1